ncbi:MoaD/ThiS family protein [Solimonas sp. K1W22B-7]|uniref:MoaD/ThiS family protein n=1 Tax=Solimonas sp. K1W22B-7 TaxID=2303331 RepID=UPI000E335BEC|nr:MoaD/ThiS family protein [Solimonas sp. K1W22B-7]AXQ28406.1 MoaD/ThiS family protein [Solimonas sp. K1W22B-7]
MQITFEFWGALRRAAGGDERTLALPAGALSVADALDALANAIPALGEHLDNTAVAQADRLLLRTEALEDGMRLALLPPVAGG